MNESLEDELVWRALADPIRRSMLDELSKSKRTTGEIVSKFDGICRTAVMKHLDVLVKANLVIVERQGRLRWNHLNPVPVENVLGRWVNQHVRNISQSLGRLKNLVESEIIPAGTHKRKSYSQCKGQK